MLKKTLFALAASTLMTTPALAHSGHDVSSIASGLLHPLTGLDHLLAISAIAIWGSRQEKINPLALIIAFLFMMALGGVLGIQGLLIPGVESAIIVSVLALGLLMARQVQLGTATGIVMTMAIAFVHGQAHGGEVANATALAYIAGYLISCAALMAAGNKAGQWLNQRPRLTLVLGSAVSLTGGAIALG
ncbi:HupE/UreJ family protein [Oceanospirillum beijerinckii]|uniref:HupE/UreJ family protein n=1 Tax=Oceanospirillum beijerinckii TaxID=64976 RepID=UPI00041CDFD2|nr:HupE/UreJ family protein [Oceanospirillum beijerinckii]